MPASSPPLALISIWGADRPGVLHELSRLLLERGLNIVDSRAVMLMGHFALLVLVGGPAVKSDASAATVQSDLQKALSGGKLELQLSRVNPAADEAGTQMQLDVSGQDRAGVLHKIAHLLRVLNVNIEGIHAAPPATSGSPAPQATQKSVAKPAPASVPPGRFQLSLLLRVPPQTPKEMLRDYIAQLCTELGVKWSLTGGQPIPASVIAHARPSRSARS